MDDIECDEMLYIELVQNWQIAHRLEGTILYRQSNECLIASNHRERQHTNFALGCYILCQDLFAELTSSEFIR